MTTRARILSQNLNARFAPSRNPSCLFGAKPSLAVKWINACPPIIGLAHHVIDPFAAHRDVALDTAADNDRGKFESGDDESYCKRSGKN